MFAALAMICGLNDVGNPYINEGCTLVTGKKIYKEEQLCEEFSYMMVQSILPQLPEGAYFSDVKCIQLMTSV